MRRTLLVASLLFASTSAYAQTIDQQGADALAASLKRYFGQAAFNNKIVTVSPDGDAYALGFDFQALAALAPKQVETKVNVEPYGLRLKPRTDGAWDVSGALAPNGSFSFKGPEGQTQSSEWSIADGAFVGVFDPAIAYFSSAKGSSGAIAFASTEGATQIKTTVGSGSSDFVGKAGANGGVDIQHSQTMSDFVETITTPAGEGLPDMTITLRAPKVDLYASGAGFRASQMMQILAFVVENADEAKLKAAQPQYKQLLLAALPFWENVSGKYTFTDFSAETPYGTYSAGNLGFSVDMDGVSNAGKMTYSVSVSSMKLPDGMLPPWSVKIMPTDMTFHFGGANLNLDGPTRKFIEAMDLNQDPPVSDAVGEAIVAEILASDPKMTFNDTSIRNGETEITINGEATFPNLKPEVTATIEAAGFDKLEEALKTAAESDQSAAQAFTGIIAAKGFSKSLPDGKLQWVVEAKPDGSVLVNGTMLKGPDPVAPEIPEDPKAPAPGLTNPN